MIVEGCTLVVVVVVVGCVVVNVVGTLDPKISQSSERKTGSRTWS